MERTRLRELTPRCKNQQQPFQLPVEMERTRLRELTHVTHKKCLHNDVL